MVKVVGGWTPRRLIFCPEVLCIGPEWCLQTTVNLELFHLWEAVPKPLIKSWYPLHPIICYYILYPHHQALPRHPLIISFCPLYTLSRLRQGYQLACSIICMRTGSLDACTSGTYFHLLRLICRFHAEDGQHWLRNMSRRKGREADVISFKYRRLKDLSTVCSVHRKCAGLHFLYKGCQSIDWAIFANISKKTPMELNSWYSNWTSLSISNLIP